MTKFFPKTLLWMGIVLFSLFFSQDVLKAQGGINEIGSFEQDLPSYWKKGSVPSGSTLTWAKDESISMGRSLKIEKSTTTAAAIWESDNMVDLWSERHFKDVDIKAGVSYKTSGVNTNPSSDDDKWFVTYSFYRENGTFIGEQRFDIDQSVASTTGWVTDTTGPGDLILPEDSYTTIIRFIGGMNATGTVWTDEYVFNRRYENTWAGQVWNSQLGVPTGWFYWLPPNGGNDGLLSDGYENTRITDEESYYGQYSLKFDLPNGTHDGFVGTKKYSLSDVVPGDVIRISVWAKGTGLNPDSAASVGDPWSVAITPILHNTSTDNNAGWGEFWSRDIPLKFPDASSFDWQQFYVDVPVLEGALSLSVRLHPLARFQGIVYFDGLTVEKLDIPAISEIGSFEQDLPSYWKKGSVPDGSTLTWAKDESISMGRSLKIEKSTTTAAAIWESDNMVDLWSERHFKDVDIKAGVSYKTSGVNTNPSSDDDKWFVTYSFYRENGTFIGEQRFDIDQSVASTTGWVTDTTGPGDLILPEDSYTTIIRFIGGMNATGTVWTDEYVFNRRYENTWAGQVWNSQLGVPTGWFYWLPPNGGNDGLLSDGYENTRITDEESYYGQYSLKFDLPNGTHDGFVGTKKFALSSGPGKTKANDNGFNDITELTNVVPGDVIRISVWAKGTGLNPDSAASVGDPWSVAITPILHNTSTDNNAGWGEFWSRDIPLKFPDASSFDWQQFYVDVPVLEGALSLSVRLHPLARFQGIVYFDGLTVEKLDIPAISEIGSFEQDLPSYWKKGSVPDGSTLTWAKDESISMGRSLKIEKSTTTAAAIWESDNMVDLWSERHFKDVDIKAGVSYKTSGVNTNPSSDDDKWFVTYSFYRENGTFIGEQRFDIDQSVASTTGWVTDTTGPGDLILPEDSYTTIIRFIGGMNATGTVWTDEYVFNRRYENTWAGQVWNSQLGVPTGWFYWLPPNGGNDGLLSDGYENTRITDEESYYGQYSLKFDLPNGTHDGFVGTKKFALSSGPGKTKANDNGFNDITELTNVVPGDVIRISVWAKGTGLNPDSAASVGDPWSVAITPILHNTSTDNNAGWGEFWSRDIPLKFPDASSFDWQQFYVDVPVLEGALSLSVRLHPLARFQGIVYFDGLEVKVISDVTDVEENGSVPTDYSLFQNYPNPFNPSTVIKYALPQNSFVSVKIYDMLGREIKSLVNGEQNAGINTVTWNGDNEFGTKVSSGTYIYMIKAGGYTQAKKLVLLK